MRHIYCPQCGTKLIEKEIGDESDIPFCSNCDRPFFDSIYPCIITLVINEFDKLCLIKQSYGNTNRYVLVAGFIQGKESAEECVIREVKEEINQTVIDCKYIKSYPQMNRDNLMLGFVSYVKKEELIISKELDTANWFSIDESLNYLKDAKIAYQLLLDYIKFKDNIN